MRREGSERLFVAVDRVGLTATAATTSATTAGEASVAAGALVAFDLGLGPTQRRTAFVGDDLDDGALLAVLGVPGPLLETTGDDGARPLGASLGKCLSAHTDFLAEK